MRRPTQYPTIEKWKNYLAKNKNSPLLNKDMLSILECFEKEVEALRRETKEAFHEEAKKIKSAHGAANAAQYVANLSR